jgi:site-specific recombinase XerD
VKFSDVKRLLSEHYAEKSASHFNAALTVVRAAVEMAVKDKIISENPAKDLTYHKRKKPVRLTPTFEQFKAIVASVRAQRFNREAEQSGDFIEFLGLTGLAITRAHVDFETGQITLYRCKTDTGFVIPIYPQLRRLVEKLCDGKEPNERLFSIGEARKALANACRRLSYPQFTHRSLRRMFITRAIERGIDVKVISEWQGHQDGGKLILQAYNHVRALHSERIATLMSDDEPANVMPMPQHEQRPVKRSHHARSSGHCGAGKWQLMPDDEPWERMQKESSVIFFRACPRWFYAFALREFFRFPALGERAPEVKTATRRQQSFST